MSSAALCERKQSARLDLKTNKYVKSQLEEAAELSGVNLTAFILNAASEKAREVMKFHSQSMLSSAAWNNLNEILENPPKEATEALKVLMQSRRTKNGSTI
ncbi:MULTISPECIES: type II toxin-antitoxin system TacA family antitoxin [Vibrio]|uniref:type II toxin-antitoxin system TacA family antitoxin n=1 Tax=Vibrio TaxID=662 RepID=UPI001159FC5E|nr:MULTISPECIES: DUF1778 domain-containing protein [Vibrio]EGR1044243.1 DUF1778 domain-containing protein [Vibrio cholerae]EGR2081485.1 DUF1778 domain-containing protein [Vibrio cholerae]EJI2329173.1 DUF1778 domain-containing protein [Vibrio cholerae]ELJ8687124.1 DUF1778 domain-containing protein [Vibrio cholerae]ELK6274852.1 DUF1778 domain-containing protein [Vibrio cholerae]